MPRPTKEKTAKPGKDSTASLGFEANLWLASDTAGRGSAIFTCEASLRSLSKAKDNLRNNMDAAEPERSGGSEPQGVRHVTTERDS